MATIGKPFSADDLARALAIGGVVVIHDEGRFCGGSDVYTTPISDQDYQHRERVGTCSACGELGQMVHASDFAS